MWEKRSVRKVDRKQILKSTGQTVLFFKRFICLGMFVPSVKVGKILKTISHNAGDSSFWVTLS